MAAYFQSFSNWDDRSFKRRRESESLKLWEQPLSWLTLTDLFMNLSRDDLKFCQNKFQFVFHNIPWMTTWTRMNFEALVFVYPVSTFSQQVAFPAQYVIQQWITIQVLLIFQFSHLEWKSFKSHGKRKEKCKEEASSHSWMVGILFKCPNLDLMLIYHTNDEDFCIDMFILVITTLNIFPWRKYFVIILTLSVRKKAFQGHIYFEAFEFKVHSWFL